MTVQDGGAVERLSALLHLQERARAAATASALAFVMLNETTALLPYRQAALWADRAVRGASGVPVLEGDSPFAQWLTRVCRRLDDGGVEPRPVSHADIEGEDADQWAEWFPEHALWLPLAVPGHPPAAFLLLVREAPWEDGEILLAHHLSGAYAHAWAALHRPSALDRLKTRLHALPRRKLAALIAAALLVPLFPVHLSVLAPGEVVPADPALIRSPLDGVVDKFHVRPNDVVTEGQPLFDLDPTTLASKLAVARKALVTAEAEYNQAVQQAVWDAKSKAQLAIISGRIQERREEAAYLETMFDRLHVKAPRAGVAVLDDPSAWLGRPVTIGEKVMEIAGEYDTEVEAWLGVGDAIALEPGAPVTLYLNVDPLKPVHAHLRYAAYAAQPQPDGRLAYRIRATVDAGTAKPRVGLRGTARLEGHRVPLIYWLLRKPWAAVRQALGV